MKPLQSNLGTSSGRKCDGYEYTEPIPPNLNTPISKNIKELRSFDFFQKRTSSQLAGLFQDELWATSVVQIACFEPGIRHAVFALASFHEHFMDPAGSVDQAFALSQYNLAIKALLNPVHKQTSPFVHLFSCVIFICIEVSLWLFLGCELFMLENTHTHTHIYIYISIL
jgi:hypothetical protein